MKQAELQIIKEGKTGHGILIENDGFISLDFGKNNHQLKEDISEKGWFVPYPFVVDAVFQKFGVKNANGRIYPESILKREVEKYQNMIAERMALGELNHPAESTIDLGRIAINIVELHWEGATLVGYGIVSTRGDDMANLIINGYKIGVSSRGVGSVEQKLGQYIVGDDFELICWDVVSSPSTPGAYVGKPEELQQYIESNTNNSGKNSINEKINKIKNILNS